MPDVLEICPVQLPGREDRLGVAPYTDISSLLQDISTTLLPHLSVPFAFFGHSMGSLIAFELARYLRRCHNIMPVRLFLSASIAPQLLGTTSSNILHLHHLSDAEFIQQIMQMYDHIPHMINDNDELIELILPVLRADFELCESYVYVHERPLSCPISLFGGLQDIHATREELIEWHKQTTSSFTLHMLDGKHFFVDDSYIDMLQAIMQDMTAYLV